MWSYHQRDNLKDLDEVEVPTVGRRLDVGGFVFADTFDDFLRSISEDYLRVAWRRLSGVLAQKGVVADDLSWGWMHPGETGFLGERPLSAQSSSPSDFIGWTSCDLSEMWRSEEDRPLDEALRVGKPPLRCTCTWRSLKWKIAPDNYFVALRLIEAICVDEIADWHPDIVLQGIIDPTELWRKVAVTIRDDDQYQLNLLLGQAEREYTPQAEREYTPLGLRILVRGYATYLHGGVYEGNITLPESV